MKKWIFCVLVLGGVLVVSLAGFGGEDVGKLQPVQVVMIRYDSGRVELLTDTEDVGRGENVHQAVAEMQQTASAKVFLDTADYLVIEPGTEIWIPQLQQYLRPSCNLCYATETVDLKQAGEYLKQHEPALMLSQYEAGLRKIPYLTSDEGRLKLV